MYRKITLQLWLMLAAIPFAYPQSGTLVPTFGDNGIKQIDFNRTRLSHDNGYVVKIEKDGKIVIGGKTISEGEETRFYFCILHLNSDGSIDSTFSKDGKLLIPVKDVNNIPFDKSFVVDSNGRVLLAGLIDSCGYSISRLNGDGNPDSAFNDDGKMPVNEFNDKINISLDSKGKIILAGRTSHEHGDFCVMRLNDDGTFDNTFDDDGKLLLQVGGYESSGLNIDINDKIVIAGNSDINGQTITIAIRINNDGRLDSTFSYDGKLAIPLVSGGDYFGETVTCNSNGKILIKGNDDDKNFYIVRVNTDGSFDNTFNNGEVLTIHYNSLSYPYAGSYSYASDSKGQMTLIIPSYSPDLGYTYSLLRWNTDGTADTTFDGDGELPINFGFNYEPERIAVDITDNILIVGTSFKSNNSDFNIVRLKSDGSPDSTFNGSGKILINGNDALLIPVEENNEARDLVSDKAGKITLAGSSFNGYGYDFAATRLNANGQIDTTFNGNGKLVLPVGNFDASSHSRFVNIAGDVTGKVWIAGTAFNYADNDFGIACIDSRGIPDPVFDGDGIALIPVGNFDDFVNGIKLLSNGKIIVLGYSFTGTDHVWDSYNGSIIRLNSDGSPDITFNGTGKQILPDVMLSKCLQEYPDGKLLIAGRHRSNEGLTLVIIHADGSFESPLNVTTGNGFIDVAIDKNNKILMLWARGEHNYHNLLSRYNLDGSIDSTFGISGTAELKPGDGNYKTIIPGIADAGSIFLAGSNSGNFSFLRLRNNGSVDTTFGQNGKMVPTNGQCNTMLADSNYIWMAGSANGDYKIIKLYARNFQHIDFVLPDTVKVGDPPIKLSGTASSGLHVSYMSSNQAIASISHDTLCITGPGSVTITARQDGHGSFYAADPVTEYLVVQRNITAIPTREIDKEIRAYPNPVSGILCLESPGKINSVVLTGVEGTLFYERTDINAYNFTFDISGYKPGFYILTIRLEDNYPEHVLKILKY